MQDAAKMVGISKKSLDDYFCQLRLGEQYDFDFKSNLDKGIGVLRSYVKQQKTHKIKKNKNHKYPKKLDLILDDQHVFNNKF